MARNSRIYETSEYAYWRAWLRVKTRLQGNQNRQGDRRVPGDGDSGTAIVGCVVKTPVDMELAKADYLRAKYRDKGVLIDTNILLLYFVGGYDQQLIENWSRTGDRFVAEDLMTLHILLEGFQRYAVTPHVLTEVSNLLGNLKNPARAQCRKALAQSIRSEIYEKRTPSIDLVADSGHLFLGITDVSIMDAAVNEYLVLTDILDLYEFLEQRAVDVMNFNEIRPLAY